MRNVTRYSLTIALFVLAASAMAQRPGGGRGGENDPVALLNIKEVRAELKITDDQQEQLKKFVDDQSAKRKDIFANFKDLSDDDKKTKFTEWSKASKEASTKLLSDTLKPDQMKRLTQLYYQKASIMVVNDNEEVAKALALTDEQKEKLKTIATDLGKEVRELTGGNKGGFNKEASTKMTALRKEYVEKATAVLTDEQKKKWDDLTGEKFEFPAPMFGRPQPKKTEDK